ncbi:MAG TPA: 2-succinyl-6-hydroxy-2,4-cyclohexadiene-1-carboxylate synthase [Thermomicrobiaceae bacterium]|nr:2-succinyl-6-hydroxy-2,4-cyclohexadiene-1-carboxylate synthase [Thermomicrobiaceae bacterium]
MTLVEVNRLRLHVERQGSGPPLLLLHGFTGSGAAWAPQVAALSRRFDVVAVDLIGHGRSDAPADPARYRMEPAVADLVALLDRLEIERVAVLGYSMGGRVALHLALAAPGRLSALVLESASPGIDDAGERLARVRSDEALAARIERDGVAAFVDEWERIPLFASQARLPAEVWERQRAQRLAGSATGLANSLRGMGAGAMAPAGGRLGELALPVLLVVGELDVKYVALAREMAAAIPDARLAVVPDAGHSVHLEQPAAFAEIVLGFLEDAGRGTGRGAG